MARPIVITGGGTGGHIMPMVAIADALVEHGVPSHDIIFVGSRRGQERNLLGPRAERLILLPGRGLRRSFAPRAVLANLGALARIGWSLIVAFSLVIRLRPRAVVSVGGYAAFPMVAATTLVARPRHRLFLVELDATPGLVHRVAARRARAVLFGLEPVHHSARSHVVGVPLRDTIERLDRTPDARAAAKSARDIPRDALSVVVMTGSLGARRVNEAVVDLAIAWRDRADVVITHVTGTRDSADMAQRAHGRTGPNYRAVSFEEDMPSLWATADVAICRAGAATVAELSYLAIPSILVPLPHAPGDHQTKNARSLEQRGAAIVLADADCDAATLRRALDPLVTNESVREKMQRGARSLHRAGAARRIVEIVEGVWPPRHVHVVGAGGAGMSGVVRYFSDAGSRVSGSDRADSDTLHALRAYGSFFVGSNVAEAKDADLVTWSPAVDAATDADVLAGQAHGMVRSELLALITRHHTTLAVTGTHGKTTGSSMLVHIARAAQWRPSWLIGAEVRGVGTNGRCDGDTLVLELDESYGSFRHTIPQGLAITNIEPDHLDHYGDLATLETAFVDLALSAEGPVVVFQDGVSREVIARLANAITVGYDSSSMMRIDDVVTTGDGASCVVRGADIEIPIVLSVPGRHNLVNAAVVAVLAHQYGATPEEIAAGLANFRGAPRRFERRGLLHGARLIDDYAHLPAEIAATLQAARDSGAERVLAIFQPHRITRTAALANDFGPVFDLATDVIVTDIYDAGEANPHQLHGDVVVDAIRRHGHRSVSYVPELDSLRDELLRRAGDYDMVIVMGAGDVGSILDDVVVPS